MAERARMGNLTEAQVTERLSQTETFAQYRYWQTETLNDRRCRALDTEYKIDGFIYPTDHPGSFIPTAVRHQTNYDYPTVTLRDLELRHILRGRQPSPLLLIHCYQTHTLIADLPMIASQWARIPRDWVHNTQTTHTKFLPIHRETLRTIGALWV